MSGTPNGHSAYGDTHRAFLQAFLAQQVMNFDAVRTILAAIDTAQFPDRQPEILDREDVLHMIDSVNSAVSPFDFEIRVAKHQKTQEEVFALVNTTDDAMTQMSTTHAPDEIAFVRRVLNAMFETYNTREAEIMAVTSMQANRLAKARSEDRRDSGNAQAGKVTSLTQSQAECVMNAMVHEGWFELSRNGFYSLSPRALMELREWLVDTYNEPVEEDDEDEEAGHVKIKTCSTCKDVVTMGQRCPNLDCTGRMHTACVDKMFRIQGGSKICPVCKNAWEDPLPVGERAASRRSQANGHASSSRRSRETQEDDE